MNIQNYRTLPSFISGLSDLSNADPMPNVHEIDAFIEKNRSWIEEGCREHHVEMEHLLSRLADRITQDEGDGKRIAEKVRRFAQRAAITIFQREAITLLPKDIWGMIMRLLPPGESRNHKDLKSLACVSRSLREVSRDVLADIRIADQLPLLGFARYVDLKEFLISYGKKVGCLDLNGLDRLSEVDDVLSALQELLRLCPNLRGLYSKSFYLLEPNERERLEANLPKIEFIYPCRLTRENGGWAASKADAVAQMKDVPDGHYRVWFRPGEKPYFGLLIKYPGVDFKHAGMMLKPGWDIQSVIERNVDARLAPSKNS